jgi:hypothetical protein
VAAELKGKGREASLVFAQEHAVQPDSGGGHHPFKVDEDALAAGGGGQAEMAAIDGDELIGFFVEAVPRHAEIGVGHGDAGEMGVVKVASAGRGRGGGAIAPIAVDGQHEAALSRRGWFSGKASSGQTGGDGCAGQGSSTDFEKIATIHKAPWAEKF